jgi:pimeloyl-ACP methyl ester carboxylesterase
MMNKSLRLATMAREQPPTAASDDARTGVHVPYAQDAFERWVLFLDTLRERADNMIAHERQGMPPLLDFDYELLRDARNFERPANYALLRITRVGDDCWDDCVDEAKPPVIIIDPRAGHGPGIGGFKRDSEVGMAMHEGHPVYFVIFFPEPMPGQTLADVHYALRDFVSEVARRHPDKAPVLYGNCQAGWAATLLAADCEGLTGPVVLNGSPLSYWSGEAASSPMRMMGALSGGAWAAHMISDLGDGRFDGAWLAQNFETLQPEKAIWDKYATLFARADTERERFLEFERWWNGYFTLSREEILGITQNLLTGWSRARCNWTRIAPLTSSGSAIRSSSLPRRATTSRRPNRQWGGSPSSIPTPMRSRQPGSASST